MATVGGVCNKYSSALSRFVKPAQIKIGHGFLGSIVFVFAAMTICVGINQTWMDEKEAEFKLGTMLALALCSFYVVTKSIKTALTRAVSMSKK